jgi:hypothetical protein
MFAEAVQIVDSLMRNERTSFEGTHYRLRDAPFAPKPVQQPRVPIVIGTSGRRMLRVVARYADMWDTSGTPEQLQEKTRMLEAACREVGRDSSEIRRITGCGTDMLASPQRFRDWVRQHRELGFTDFRLEYPQPEQLDRLRTIAETVLPDLRRG